MGQLIICGQGHGLTAVYEGLIDAKTDFTVCTEDAEIIARAKIDKIKVVGDYLESIASSDDVVLTSAYKPKIPGEHLAKCRFLNIHYGLLPRYRGMHPIVWSILNGENEIGFTVHETSVLLDQGPVIFQESLPVGSKTSWQLMEEVDARVKEKIACVIEGYKKGRLKPVPQIEEDAIFVAPRNREDCRVDWKSWDAVFFGRALQALVLPYPRPFFDYKGALVEIEKAEVISRAYREIPGHVVYVDESSAWVKIPDGLLRLYRVVVDGKSVAAHEYFCSIGLRL